jgi:ribose transport system ATP-binding protein
VDNKILFKVENVSKYFPGTKALQSVSMDVREGEIVGLVGENGAGKSTLLKIMIGVQPPTDGSMQMRGAPYEPKNPKDGNAMGVGMVFQEQSLVSNLTVGQNIFFGEEKKFLKAGLFVNWPSMYRAAKAVLGEIGITDIKPETKIKDLNFARRQMVEISKVLNAARSSAKEKTLILLDEPTSVLNDEEVKTLFTEIKKMKAEGHSIIFVSHRLDEVMEISDRVYVFKDGLQVGELERKDVSEDRLYELMVGRTSTGEYFKVADQKEPQEDVVIEVDKIGLTGRFKDVSFKLHKGEILGFCGVIGSGKEDVCAILSGDLAPNNGTFKFNGSKVKFSEPHDALKKGIISVPKERRDEGILGMLSILENITIANLEAAKKFGFVSKKKQQEISQHWIDTLNVKCTDYNEDVSSLSGGNAQKVVFARMLAADCSVLILNHPTRGVDVGAKEELYELIREMANRGLSIILLGDTLDESIGLSSRIIVMKDGLITQEIDASKNNKPEQLEIIKHMM